MLKRINPCCRIGRLKMVLDPLSRWWRTGSTCCRTSSKTSPAVAWLCTAPRAWDGKRAKIIATQNAIFTEASQRKPNYIS